MLFYPLRMDMGLFENFRNFEVIKVCYRLFRVTKFTIKVKGILNILLRTFFVIFRWIALHNFEKCVSQIINVIGIIVSYRITVVVID